MIFVLNDKGDLTYASPAWGGIADPAPTGHWPSDWLGHVHADDRGLVRDTLTTALREQAPFTLRFRLNRAADEVTPVLATAMPAFDIAHRLFIGFSGTVVALEQAGAFEAGGLVGQIDPAPRRQLPGDLSPSTLRSVTDHLLAARGLLLAAQGGHSLRQLIETGLYVVALKRDWAR